MIIFPSGTIVVTKVDGSNNFIENALTYEDLGPLLDDNLVTISGSQTISGQKTFLQPVRTKSHQNFTGSEHVLVTSGIQTTDDSIITILSLPIDDDSAYWAEAYVIGRRTDGGSPFRARMQCLQAMVFRQGGNPADRVGTSNNILTRSKSAGSYDCEIDVSGNNLIVTVNGNTAETVSWVCSVRYQKVSLNI